jgi:hypothetical protein
MTTETKSLITRLKEYFGMTTAEMRKEYVRLTQQDKEDFVKMLNDAGMPTALKTTSN